jgi:PAS domain S-box-containing protein
MEPLQGAPARTRRRQQVAQRHAQERSGTEHDPSPVAPGPGPGEGDALRRQVTRQAAVADFARTALESRDAATVLQAAAEVLAETLDVEYVSVLRVGSPGEQLRYCAGVGWPNERVGDGTSELVAGGQIRFTLDNDDPVVSDDLSTETRFRVVDTIRELGLMSTISGVVRGLEVPYGVITVHTTSPRRFDSDDSAHLRTVANLVGSALARDQIEGELAHSEHGLRLALEAGDMGVWFWNRRADTMVFTEAMERLCGLTPGSFSGTPQAFLDLVHPDDRGTQQHLLDELALNGNPIDTLFRVVARDGRDRWLAGRYRAINGEHADECVGVSIDITERKRIEDRLAEALARLDTLLDAAPVGFALLDEDLRYLRVNEHLAAIDGVPALAHRGHSIVEIVPELAEELVPVLRRVLETGTPQVGIEVSGEARSEPGVEHTWLASIYQVREPTGRVTGVGVVVNDITERQRAERTTRLIGAANELFASPLAPADLLERLVELAVPELADVALLYVHGESLQPQVRIAHMHPSMDANPGRVSDRFEFDEHSDVPGAIAYRTGSTQLIEEVTEARRRQFGDSGEHGRLLEKLEVGSILAVPLRVGERVLGVLALIYQAGSRRRYSDADHTLAEGLASRFAQAIDNAWLTAEAALVRRRVDLLARMGELMTVELSSKARIEAVVDLVIGALADSVAVFVLRDERELVLLASRHNDPERERRLQAAPWTPIDAGSKLAPAVAVREGRPILIAQHDSARTADLLASDDERTLMRALDIGSTLCVPMWGRDGVMGVLAFANGTATRRFEPEDVRLAEEVARRAGAAVENAQRFEEEHASVEVLQRALLPSELPDVDDVELAARYAPSAHGANVGGDWYDVLRLADGRLLLAIGDVAGHGVQAATAMGRLRTTLQIFAFEGGGPGAILQRVAEHAGRRLEHELATLALVVLDIDQATISFASAGHPPPALLRSDGSVELLDGARNVPLGIPPIGPMEEGSTTVGAGEVLFLYTDGLIERREESLDVGFARLGEALAGAEGRLDDIIDHVMHETLLNDRSRDDVAVLALRPSLVRDRMEWWLPAEHDQLPVLRGELLRWLSHIGAQPVRRNDMVLAVHEAMANAIEHAYPEAGGSVGIVGRRDGDEALVTVRDFGEWREAPGSATRGRGLTLMRSLVDDVHVGVREQGTEVTLRCGLRERR